MNGRLHDGTIMSWRSLSILAAKYAYIHNCLI